MSRRLVAYLFSATLGFMAFRFLLTPVRIKVLTTLLDKTEYGTLSLLISTASCLAVLCTCGSLEFLRSRCPGAPASFQYGALQSSLIFVPIAAALAFPIAGLLAWWQPAKLHVDGPDYFITAAIAVLMLHIVQRVYFLMGQRKYLTSRVTMVVHAELWFMPLIPFWFAGALTGVWFMQWIPFWNDGVLTVRTVLAAWCGWLLLTLLVTHSWIGFRRMGSEPVERVPFATLLRFGAPLLPMIVGDWLFQLQDRYVLITMMDATAVANYALCVSVAMVGFAAGASVIDVFSTEFFKLCTDLSKTDTATGLAAHERLRGVFDLMIRYGLFVTVPVMAGLGFMGEPILAVISDPKYIEVAPLLQWTAPIPVLFVLYYILGRVLLAMGRNLFLGGATLAAGLLNIALNIMLVPLLDERGTALATVISLLVLIAALGWAMHIRAWIPRYTPLLLRTAAAYAACAGGLLLIRQSLPGPALLTLVAGATWCLAACLASGLTKRADLADLRACLADRSSP